MFQGREPDFSRLRKVLLREGEPDIVPFYELFADGEIIEAILGRPPMTLMDRVEFQIKMGYDYVPVGNPGVFDFPRPGESEAEDTAKTGRKNRRFRLSNVSAIHTWDDYERYPWPDPSKGDYSELEELERIMPKEMKAIVMTGHIIDMPMAILGYENLAYMAIDNPELLEAIIERIGEVYETAFRVSAQMDCVGALLICDDLAFKTGTMISPSMLRKWVFPWYKRYSDISHRYGKPMIIHSCGNLEEVMEDIIETCHIDAKHSFEDQIMPVTEAKRRYGDRISILGGLDMGFLATASEDEVRERTRRVLHECMPGGGYALGTGNTVANYIPVANYIAMLDEGNKVGRY